MGGGRWYGLQVYYVCWFGLEGRSSQIRRIELVAINAKLYVKLNQMNQNENKN